VLLKAKTAHLAENARQKVPHTIWHNLAHIREPGPDIRHSGPEMRQSGPQFCTHKTVRIRFWPWLSGKSLCSLLSCPLFARKLKAKTAHLAENARQKVSLRAKREHIESFHLFLPESHGHNLFLTVLYMLDCPAHNLAHIRQSRPDSGLGFQVKVLKTFQVVPFFAEAESEDRAPR
jgi:hypothetical protein